MNNLYVVSGVAHSSDVAICEDWGAIPGQFQPVMTVRYAATYFINFIPVSVKGFSVSKSHPLNIGN